MFVLLVESVSFWDSNSEVCRILSVVMWGRTDVKHGINVVVGWFWGLKGHGWDTGYLNGFFQFWKAFPCCA